MSVATRNNHLFFFDTWSGPIRCFINFLLGDDTRKFPFRPSTKGRCFCVARGRIFGGHPPPPPYHLFRAIMLKALFFSGITADTEHPFRRGRRILKTIPAIETKVNNKKELFVDDNNKQHVYNLIITIYFINRHMETRNTSLKYQFYL